MVICGVAGTLAMPVQNAVAEEKATKITCPPGTKYAGKERDNYAQCNLRDSGNDSATAVTDKINNGINVALGLIGVIAVVMIIIGGIQYTTSAGDAGKAQKARNTILFSIVGLVVALLAFAIVNFVLKNVF